MPTYLPRRSMLGLLGGATAAAIFAEPVVAQEDARDWAMFKARFLSADGRIIDNGNGNQSHSEGQGWGLSLAQHHDDRPAFDRILAWTRRNLRRDSDRLHAWRWRPDQQPAVQDSNNATDGDLFIASALLRGGRRWSDPALTEEGTAIARDVLRLLVRRAGGHLVLLPGARGFEHRTHVVINPSYYSYPAIAAVAEAVPDPAWLRVASDGLRLLRMARFGRWGLSPDWLAVSRTDGQVSPAQGWPARFSYDAVRVPLWLACAGLSDEPAVEAPFAFWSDSSLRQVPAWADLSDDRVAPYPAGSGVLEIGRFVARQKRLSWDRPLPDGGVLGRDYYDTALMLLARMGAAERGILINKG
ncbi:glycosyl hydrolase family 5 [Roseomonas sp. SSH11]|uniref:cellulase n=1 Tax=Pararoseomonas baculiformis TaxID=2820812 RepID=A0ABS4AKG0_9PROT|nr:glycosyl hydrolase family 8 [Pararoseomonas baculiformis]MBP0447371.1 glycosyl hydrolase family 5 [Pararoseomonas baculiformis]